MIHFPSVTRSPIPLTLNQSDWCLQINPIDVQPSFHLNFSKVCAAILAKNLWLWSSCAAVYTFWSPDVLIVSSCSSQSFFWGDLRRLISKCSLCFPRTSDLSNWIQSPQGSVPFPLYWTKVASDTQCPTWIKSHLLGASPFVNVSSLPKRISLKNKKWKIHLRFACKRFAWCEEQEREQFSFIADI